MRDLVVCRLGYLDPYTYDIGHYRVWSTHGLKVEVEISSYMMSIAILQIVLLLSSNIHNYFQTLL